MGPRRPPTRPRTSRRDIVGVLDRLGWRSAVLVGHSMGGHNAIACAAWHPERVRGLVIVDSRPAIPAERLAQMKERGARPPRRHATVEAAVAAFRLLPPETARIPPCSPTWRARASRGGTAPSACGSTRRATRRACRSTRWPLLSANHRADARGPRGAEPDPPAPDGRASSRGAARRPARRDRRRLPPSGAGPARAPSPARCGASWTDLDPAAADAASGRPVAS